MIRHVVMLKFKKDADPAKIDTFIEEVKKLSHLNREVRDYSHGLCVKTRFHSGDFDFANCCDIDSYEAMERYMSHWAHLRMTPFLPDILENMLSFDWEIDYHGPAFDEKLAAEEAARETARVLKRHDDAAKAYVPEVRGQTRERALEMLGAVGLVLAAGEEEIIGSVWAPNRIMFQSPDPDTVVDKGTAVTIGITGNWLTGPAVPEGDAPAW
ncbi:MAG: Dabb family protein [Sphingomonadales bacterium]|nr:Dabb family protein [Sphingomonadales bacterium]